MDENSQINIIIFLDFALTQKIVNYYIKSEETQKKKIKTSSHFLVGLELLIQATKGP